jgi:kynurenine formamidase
VQDLTYTVSPGFPVFPGYPPMEVARRSTIEVNGSNGWSPVDYPCSMSRLSGVPSTIYT